MRNYDDFEQNKKYTFLETRKAIVIASVPTLMIKIMSRILYKIRDNFVCKTICHTEDIPCVEADRLHIYQL